MNPADFWGPFDSKIDSFKRLSGKIERVSRKWPGKVFAWRGQVDAGWALHSSLYRRLCLTGDDDDHLPEEDDLYDAESRILIEVHRWGLHVIREVGRLSILNQLAALQHHGAPTRLIDVTFNPWIATWFAVEEKFDNTVVRYADRDARLFAIDVTDRLINENRKFRDWEDDLHRPWPGKVAREEEDREVWQESRKVWRSQTFAWRPPHFDSRIAAQNGGFIFGGVPASYGPEGPVQWPKGSRDLRRWKINDVRASTSVALRPHKLNAKKGGVTQNAVYSFKIAAAAKAEIRQRLEKSFGYQHKTIYPDLTGFALHGSSYLKSR